ncbi:MAG TPA: adenosylcobinamide-GDP ribazoletransferase [Chloroflexota bacterium]|nr:adenosylcobinamide-GDP ribazoletransferase [Chloroflexota bacterium]
MLAWSFLTVLPSPRIAAGSETLASALAFFPVVGMVLGALLGGLGMLLDRALPPGPVAILLLSVEVTITGGLHLDGLMDTADGVFGGQTAERRLEIMRDSRVGSFGALAGALALIAQFACLSDLAGVTRLIALVVTLGLGRWAMVTAIGRFPSARATGLGATFQAAGRRRSVVLATLVSILVACATGLPGLVACVCAVGVVFLGGHFFTKRLGGLTGDTYGALAVITETAVLFVAVAFRGA